MVELNENLEHYQEILTLFKQNNYNINNELTSISMFQGNEEGLFIITIFLK